MVRSTEAASWPLKVRNDLAPHIHIIEDLIGEKNEVMHLPFSLNMQHPPPPHMHTMVELMTELVPCSLLCLLLSIG